jgi:hypothetical protein
MKILFLCGSIEPGQDGVGDYTIRLALELVSFGHEITIISLYDKFINNVTNSSGEGFASIRLPYSMDEAERFNEVVENISSFNPEWISLQFVIFSYHPKGLPFQLPSKMKALLANRKVHIMFHELWVAMDNASSFKLKFLGWLQKKIIQKTIQAINPRVIHTHTKLYQWQLKEVRVESTLLPLFGNIPVVSVDQQHDNTFIKVVVFGTIHFGAPLELFANEFHEYLKDKKKIAEVIFVGRCGAYQESWIRAFQKEGIKVNVLGEQTVEQISKLLLSAGIGITSTPFLLTEKSGTVAAMLEHELQVICVAREWTVSGFEPNYLITDGIFNYKKGSLSDFFNNKSVKNSQNIHSITRQFIQSLRAK